MTRAVIRVSEPRTPDSNLPSVNLESMTFQAITEAQCVAHILDSLDTGRGGWVVTPNVQLTMLNHEDEAFRRAIATASLCVADGMPLIWASRLRGTPLPERVCGSDLVSSVSTGAARRGRSIYLLGGQPGTAKLTADRLRELNPGLEVVGIRCPDWAPAETIAASEELRRELGELQPDIVFVALGSPKQELLIPLMKDVLPGSWWLGVGAGFDFVSGLLKRAPRWVQQSGLEWLHRLPQDPRRLGRRYLLKNFPFVLGLLRRAIRDRWVGP